MKMNKSRYWYDLVKEVLTENPEARDDDFILYLDVCRLDTNAPVWAISFEDALLHSKEYALPSYEGVTRARRRVQKDCCDLRGNRYDKRMGIRDEFREEYGR